MRIMIIQAEIEEAIAEKVLRQMSINDDMELKINLSATRGDEGFTATIDVVAKAVEEEPLQAPPRRRAAKTTAAPAATTTTDAKPKDDGPASDEPVAQDPPEDDEQQEEAAPAAPTGSIFGNLRKPVNTPAAAAAAE